jgi:hypothetical protein
MKKTGKDKPAIRPDKKVCDACSNHGICGAEAGMMNYECPRMVEIVNKKNKV